MALFRTNTPSAPKPTSPVSLFRSLRRAPEVKFLWAHQERTLETYNNQHLQTSDVALELPTGSGKTLVGLLIAEFRRRAFDQRVAVLCPTKQLCAQVVKQAKKYGIPCSLLVGSQSDYIEKDFSDYQRGRAIGVTTYSGLFNNNPRISNPQTIICDDAHSGEGFVADMWTLRINRKTHKKLFKALFTLLRGTMSEAQAYLIDEESDDPKRLQVDMLSPIAWNSLVPKIRETIDSFLTEKEPLHYVWKNVQDSLIACSAYCTASLFEFRPTIPPTFVHTPFTGAVQRLYMSATLGEDGDLERCFGRKKIGRIPMTEGWTTGRRLILFPELSDLTAKSFLTDVIKTSGKTLVLTPSDAAQEKLEKKIESEVAVLKSADSEADIQIFRDHPTPVALVLANRYDGIDFPGDECRCEIIMDMPLGSSLEELFFTQRLRAMSILRDRLRTRVTQAMGRCTRDESDYSAVLIFGERLVHWFSTHENVEAMHPELQGEVQFGLENSTERTAASFIELVKAILGQTEDWEQAEQAILKESAAASRAIDPNAAKLQASCVHEVEFGNHLWSGRYDQAYASADAVLKILSGDEELRAYRCFWEHQAATAAFLNWQITNDETFKKQCILRLRKASGASFGLSWLSHIASSLEGTNPPTGDTLPYVEWFSAIEGLVTDLQLHGGKFARAIESNRENIASDRANQFHNGLEFLGKMLGAEAKQWPTGQTGKPDGFWSFGFWKAFVFEAKMDLQVEDSITLTTIRQASTHLECVRSDKFSPPLVPCETIVVSRRKTLRTDAQPHADKYFYVAQESLVELFDKAAQALTELRILAQTAPSDKLPAMAIELYKKHDVFMPQIVDLLQKTKVSALPVKG